MAHLISVVIPTYNRKTIILDAITSVLQQKPKNYEVLIVDDGSTDGTAAYLTSLDLPIRIIKKKDGGVSSARNVGIKEAEGTYIAFLDSDDVWLAGILHAQLQYLESHPRIPLVYTDQYFEYEGKRNEITRFNLKKWTHEEMTRNDLPGFAKTPFMQISSIMVKKSIFAEVGYFNETLKIHEDTDMWNRISEKYEIGYIDKPFAILRWGKDTTHLLNPSKAELFLYEGEKYLQFYQERRKNREFTQREKTALAANYKRMQQLEQLLSLLKKGQLTGEEFSEKREAIAQAA